MAASTWITNITHFMPEDPARLTPEARRLRDYFGLIILAATAASPGAVERQSPVPCRRKPEHKPCPGHVIVAFSREHSGGIEWRCSHCEGNGLITGWPKTIWDLSQYPLNDHDSDPEDPEADWLDVLITQEEFNALAASHASDPDSQRIVMGATWTDGGIRLEARASGLDRLHKKGYISDPKRKAKSVALSVEAAGLSEKLFKNYFVKPK